MVYLLSQQWATQSDIGRLAKWEITVMAYDYDVHYVPGEEIGHADAMSRLRFKVDGNDLVATVSATFEKLVININFLLKELETDHFNEQIIEIEKIRTGKWNNFTEMEKEFAKKAKAPTIQNDLIHNESRVYIPVAHRKQFNAKLQDIHQAITHWNISSKMLLPRQ